jgi:alpha-galactosidase
VTVKLAYIGGGSLFAPSIANGIGEVLRISSQPFEVELSLYDIRPERAERMRVYAAIVAGAWGVPLRASVATSREQVLEGADLVLGSVWLQDEHERLNGLLGSLGGKLPLEGPEVAAWALACAPWSLGLAADMRRYSPGARFVTLMNPTDVIAGLVHEVGGVPAAGLCVEVDHLRAALAYYFRVPYDSIQMAIAGVNHDGWVLGLTVDGQDGYELWRERWPRIEADPDFHPGNRGMLAILSLTGHLKSSAYHNWPYQVDQTPESQALWAGWQGKREMLEASLATALRTDQPIANAPGIHPERSRIMYPFTGLTVGRLLQSLATGEANVLAMQVPNRGAISNFPAEAMVELNVLARARELSPLPVGELPEWLGGYTRLQAIQRRLIVNYLVNRDLATLKQALAVLPMFASVQQYNRFAEALHREYST